MTQLLACCLVYRMDDNGLQSTLHVNSVDPSDFTEEYECWMQNKNGTLDPARILIIHRHRKFTNTHCVQ